MLLMLFIMQLTGFVIILLMRAAVASVGVNATGPWCSRPMGTCFSLVSWCHFLPLLKKCVLEGIV